jgi:acetylornithine/succinyldiaminopimelate/putrescine aminotransferase
LKLSRKYGKGRSKILAFHNSFHGRTYGAVSVTGSHKYKDGFEPLLPDIVFAEPNNIASVKDALSDQLCAIILEPIQGEGGVVAATEKFLSELRKICDEKDIVLIFDEVQCGMGRVGKLFAYQFWGIEPDVVCIAKGLGGGFPVGAVLAKEKVASAFRPGDHGTTFGGNPLAMSVAKAALTEIMKDDFLANVEKTGKYLFEKLTRLQKNYSVIKDVRGCGLMLGVELAHPNEVILKSREHGLLLAKAGKNTLRFLPPLIVTREHVDEAATIFEKSL